MAYSDYYRQNQAQPQQPTNQTFALTPGYNPAGSSIDPIQQGEWPGRLPKREPGGTLAPSPYPGMPQAPSRQSPFGGGYGEQPRGGNSQGVWHGNPNPWFGGGRQYNQGPGMGSGFGTSMQGGGGYPGGGNSVGMNPWRRQPQLGYGQAAQGPQNPWMSGYGQQQQRLQPYMR